jgi:hypothetical protein
VAAAMMDVIGPDVGLLHKAKSESPIERGAALLNSYYRTNVRPSAEELSSVAGAVSARLQMTRDDAIRGRFTVGVTSAAEVAVGLAADAGISQLWPDIVGFLLDPRVSRRDKEAPLERLARAEQPLPMDVLRELGSGIETVLSARSIDPLGTEVLPFPAALRFAATHELLSDEAVLAHVARLGGAYGVPGRVEAARTLALMVRSGRGPDWADALVLQLSHDGDPVVRGESGRCLATLLRRGKRHRELVEQRVLQLLNEDGLVVPVLVLRGFQEFDGAVRLSGEVLAYVRKLSTNHPARGVRLQAAAVLAAPGAR